MPLLVESELHDRKKKSRVGGCRVDDGVVAADISSNGLTGH